MKETFEELKDLIQKEKAVVRELKIFFRELRNIKNKEEENIIKSELSELRVIFIKLNNQVGEKIDNLSLIKPIERNSEIRYLGQKEIQKQKLISEPRLKKKVNIKEFELTELEELTLERLKRKEKKIEIVKERKPNPYLKFSNKLFFNISNELIREPFFNSMRKDIIKSNLEILPRTYLSMIILTTIISVFFSIIAGLFFLFFNFGVKFPFITATLDPFGARLSKIFWMFIVIPLITFFSLYFYPSLEKKSNQSKIEQELPFATIHMSAVSGSMVDPSRIFSILIKTGDYPNISKQFIKLLNQINLQGYSLVNALRVTALNGPSNKLSELLNGLATTITSGGDLPEFFEKRADSLMLEYRLEKEKYAKTAETFMDIYISVVIAAPMILMLLLIMMQISGIGIGLSSGMISLVMSLGVAVINFAFLVFLHLRGEAGGEQ